eukprot:6764951-Lingulodinium_polyedra.AAC.1
MRRNRELWPHRTERTNPMQRAQELAKTMPAPAASAEVQPGTLPSDAATQRHVLRQANATCL